MSDIIKAPAYILPLHIMNINLILSCIFRFNVMDTWTFSVTHFVYEVHEFVINSGQMEVSSIYKYSIFSSLWLREEIVGLFFCGIFCPAG